jgi:hypothetical protein
MTSFNFIHDRQPIPGVQTAWLIITALDMKYFFGKINEFITKIMQQNILSKKAIFGGLWMIFFGIAFPIYYISGINGNSSDAIGIFISFGVWGVILPSLFYALAGFFVLINKVRADLILGSSVLFAIPIILVTSFFLRQNGNMLDISPALRIIILLFIILIPLIIFVKKNNKSEIQ